VFDDAARTFLEKPLIARLATLDGDGYPHNVPLWYVLDGSAIVMVSERTARKVRNIQANPRGTLTVGGDIGDGAGYMIKGDITIEEDIDKAILRKLTFRYETQERAEELLIEWANDDIIVLRLQPTAVRKVF
jgi:PPOX class probable F420-dependent enzyme